MTRREDEHARIMENELEDALGAPVDDEVARDAAEQSAPTLGSMLSSSKLLVGITFAVVVMVGAMLSLALDSWLLLPVLTLVHAVVTFLVVTVALRLTTQVDKPDPSTVARLEAEGMDDPEKQLNESIRKVATDEGDEKGPVQQVLTDNAEETPDPNEDPAKAAARQQIASTPSSEPTRTQDQR